MNWPNRLTLLRFLLVPVIIVLLLVSYYVEIKSGAWKWYFEFNNFKLPILIMVAGIVFILASFTDFLDGYLARKNNQVTEFGKFFDPIADKLLVNSTLILFAVMQILPVWIVVVLILRDTFVDFIRMILAKKQITLAAGIFGKLKTIFQMVGLSILFFITWIYFTNGTSFASEWSWLNQIVLIPMYLAVGFSIYSGVDYFIKAKVDLF